MKTKIFTSLLLAATMTIGMCSTAFASEYDIDGMDVSGITVKFYQKLNPEGGDAESDYFKKKIEEWLLRMIISIVCQQIWHLEMHQTYLCSMAEAAAWIM